MNPFALAFKTMKKAKSDIHSPLRFNELEQAIHSFHIHAKKTILLISDGAAIEMHFDAWLKSQFEKENFQVLQYQIHKNSCTWNDVQQAAALYKNKNCDMLLGCGTSISASCTKLAAACTIMPKLQKSAVFFCPHIESDLPYFGWMPFGYVSGMEASGYAFYQTGKIHKTVYDLALRPSFLLLEKDCFQAVEKNVRNASLQCVLCHLAENYCTCTLSLEERQNIRIAIRSIFESKESWHDGISVQSEMLFEAYWTLVQMQNEKHSGVLGLIDELLCIEENMAQRSFLPGFLSCMVTYGNEALCEDLHELGILAKTSSSLSDSKSGAKDFLFGLRQISPCNQSTSAKMMDAGQIEKIYTKIRPFCTNSKLAYSDIQAIANTLQPA
jgi:hypothetical protein